MVQLNKKEFNDKIFTRINNLIHDYNLINEHELIAVALSGGKDSVLTLHALKNYQNYLDFDLVAVSVDEGIEGYRQHGIDAAIDNAEKLDVKLVQKSFKIEEGFALDDIYSGFKSACIPCGVFRRNILNKTAYDLGADKIATGHNLDDETQSIVMNYLEGNVNNMVRIGYKTLSQDKRFTQKIKPLRKIPEKEIKILEYSA